MGMSGTLKRGGMEGEKIPKGYRAGQLSNYTPEQQQLFSENMSHLGPDSYLSKLAMGDQSFFNEMESPALRQFSGIQGGMASRFSGQGDFGGRHGSGFQNEMTAASSNFAQDLQSKRQGLQRQAIQDLMGYSNQLLNQRPYERFLNKKQQDQGFNWGGALGGLAGGTAGFFAGGPMGAMTGAGMGYNMGSGLSGYDSGGSSGGFQSSQGWKPSWNGQGGDSGYDFRNEMASGAGYYY